MIDEPIEGNRRSHDGGQTYAIPEIVIGRRTKSENFANNTKTISRNAKKEL